MTHTLIYFWKATESRGPVTSLEEFKGSQEDAVRYACRESDAGPLLNCIHLHTGGYLYSFKDGKLRSKRKEFQHG